MQLTHLTNVQAAEVLADSKVLTVIEWPGSNRTHVLEANGRDVLLVQDAMTGDAMMIDACVHDADSNGSIHDHARAVFADVSDAD